MRKLRSALFAAFLLAACGQPDEPATEAPPAAEAPLVAWSAIPTASIAAPEGILYTVAQVNDQSMAEIAGVPENADSALRTGGVSVRLPDDIEQQASNHRIRVTVRAMATDAGAALGVAYSTMDVGNSGWRRFELTSNLQDYSFEYDVPTLDRGYGDYLGFRNYGEQRVQVAGYRIEVIGPHATQ